jgi:hypothetical protein
MSLLDHIPCSKSFAPVPDKNFFKTEYEPQENDFKPRFR